MIVRWDIYVTGVDARLFRPKSMGTDFDESIVGLNLFYDLAPPNSLTVKQWIC